MQDSLPEIAKLNGMIIRQHFSGRSNEAIAYMLNIEPDYVKKVLNEKKKDETRIRTTAWGVR